MHTTHTLEINTKRTNIYRTHIHALTQTSKASRHEIVTRHPLTKITYKKHTDFPHKNTNKYTQSTHTRITDTHTRRQRHLFPRPKTFLFTLVLENTIVAKVITTVMLCQRFYA